MLYRMRLMLPFALLTLLSLGAGQDDEGFVPLFDGKSLEGWETVGGQEGNWSVEDGIIVTKGEGGGWLSTKKSYGNFVLSLEYRLVPGGNSGIFIRSPHEGDPAYVGMELQVLDDEADWYKNLQPYQYCGSVYGVIPAKRGHTKPAGEWNRMVITAEGPQITVRLNGETIVDGNLEDHSDAAEQHPGIKRKDGYIGLQSHSERVEFRDIKIKVLD